MDNIEVTIIILVFLLIIISAIVSKRDKYVSTGEFEKEKSKLKHKCSEAEINEFIAFLHSYKGGYFKRRSGKIVYRSYSGKEKGNLKGIFYNVVLPNSNLPISKREEFRKLLIDIGVDGLNERPSYETRDSKLRNNKENEEERKRKAVGNIGEQIVRDELSKLNSKCFGVINGPVLKIDDEIKEYDHIVVGKSGIFSIETKAFGMKEGKVSKNWLFIDKGDKWIIGKGEHGRSLISPTEQINAEKNHLLKIVNSFSVEVHSVLVLSNTQLLIKNNEKLPYDVIRADNLVEYINDYVDDINEGDRLAILSDIDKYRIN